MDGTDAWVQKSFEYSVASHRRELFDLLKFSFSLCMVMLLVAGAM